MKKFLVLFTLCSALLLTGCASKEYVYLRTDCPVIEALEIVPTVSGHRDENNCLCDEPLDDLMRTTKTLRGSETYYNERIKRVDEYRSTIDK